MATPDTALSAAAGVGRYFTVVSVVPSTLFVAYAALLVASGAFTGTPDWEMAVAEADLSVGAVAGLATATLAVAVVGHPLQLTGVRYLEGYWGTSRLGRALAVWRVAHYQQRVQHLIDESERHELDTAASRVAHVGEQAYRIERERYPRRRNHVMPTRLGNVLRRWEVRAGSAYGLSAVSMTIHLGLTGDVRRIEYLNDRRQQFDLAVRVCILAAAAFVLSVAALGDDGWHLLVALIPYAVAYLAYRGAIVAAADYGVALAAAFDLDRFALYEALHLPLPETTTAEREQNAVLRRLLDGSSTASVRYVHHPPARTDEGGERPAR